MAETNKTLFDFDKDFTEESEDTDTSLELSFDMPGDKEFEAKVIGMYIQGLSVDQLKNQYKLPSRVIREILERYNVTLRPEGTPPTLTGKSSNLTDEQLSNLISDYKKGMATRPLCAKYNVSCSKMYSLLESAGVPRRKVLPRKIKQTKE